MLADRLLVAEALPALGAAVIVDRHKRREVIPARNGGQERGVYLPNGLRIGGDGQTIRERKSAAIRGAASCRCALGRGRTIHNVKIFVAEEFAPEGCDTVLTDLLWVLHRPICLFLHLAIGKESGVTRHRPMETAIRSWIPWNSTERRLSWWVCRKSLATLRS